MFVWASVKGIYLALHARTVTWFGRRIPVAARESTSLPECGLHELYPHVIPGTSAGAGDRAELPFVLLVAYRPRTPAQ